MAKMFYTAYVESALTFCIICWFGSAAEAQERLRKIVTTASKLLGTNLNSLEHTYRERVLSKDNILANRKHTLFTTFELLPSGGRFRYPALSKNKSFTPQSISFLNQYLKRRLGFTCTAGLTREHNTFLHDILPIVVIYSDGMCNTGHYALCHL